MNIYADRGNILFLRRRCEWRGIGFAYTAAGPRRRARPRRRTTSSTWAAARTATSGSSPPTCVKTKREAVAAAVDDGAVVLAVCGGYQLLGHSYQLGDERIAGPGPRRPGDGARAGPAADRQRRDRGRPRRRARARLAGFENHGGRTYLGDGATPLGRVIRGFGNNGKDGLEGVRRANMIGTYLHGPLLPKNAWLADRLIQLALARREGAEPELEPLDDALEAAAHESAHEAAMRG